MATIEHVKKLQEFLDKKDYHIIWFGEAEFVIAHTDEERATIDLETCELHCRLLAMDDSPVNMVGYYMYLPSWNEFAFLTKEWSDGKEIKE